MEPPFGEREVVGVSDGTIRKSDVVSYRLSIVTVAQARFYGRGGLCGFSPPQKGH